MKTRLTLLAIGGGTAFAFITTVSCTQPAPPAAAVAQASVGTGASKMKMSTDIPPAITTPDSVETRLGTLKFVDGFPNDATVEKVYDNLDFQRGVQSFLLGIPAASLYAMREGERTFGPDNRDRDHLRDPDGFQVAVSHGEHRNRVSWVWLDTKAGPLVIEVPPGLLGVMDDFWFRYVADIGVVGADKGKGGKYVLLPPGYTGEVPKGYFVLRSRTFGNTLLMRGFLVNGDPTPAVDNYKKGLRVYPLAQAANPPTMTFVNASGKSFNTIHAVDFSFFEALNHVVQEEPADATDPETLGLLASIGIMKGQPFAPDARMKQILAEAASVGNATARALVFRPRMEEAKVYPDSNSSWRWLFVGGSYEFLKQEGVRNLDARSLFFYMATYTTPAMTGKAVGVGSQYVMSYTDSESKPLDGGKTLQDPPATPHPGEDLLVPRALRQPDSLADPDRPTVPEHRQPEKGHCHQHRRFGGLLVRADRPSRPRVQLGANPARQNLFRVPAPLRPAPAVVRPDLASR